MAELHADQVNSEFFKNFISETIYLIDEDKTIPDLPATADETTATTTNEVSSDSSVKETEQQVVVQSTPKSIPVLPKLPKLDAVDKPGKYKTIGENRKGVVILVTLPEDQFTKLPQLEFLNKILGAIGLQPTDVAYLNNVSGAVARFEDMQQELTVNYIISFASRLDTDLPHEKFTLYNPVNVGSVPVVFSQALAMLKNDVDHKKQLWGALKQMFL